MEWGYQQSPETEKHRACGLATKTELHDYTASIFALWLTGGGVGFRGWSDVVLHGGGHRSWMGVFCGRVRVGRARRWNADRSGCCLGAGGGLVGRGLVGRGLVGRGGVRRRGVRRRGNWGVESILKGVVIGLGVTPVGEDFLVAVEGDGGVAGIGATFGVCGGVGGGEGGVEGGGMTVLCLLEGVSATGCGDGWNVDAEGLGSAETAVVSGCGLVPDLELVDSLGALALCGGEGCGGATGVGGEVDTLGKTALDVSVCHLWGAGRAAALMRVHGGGSLVLGAGKRDGV